LTDGREGEELFAGVGGGSRLANELAAGEGSKDAADVSAIEEEGLAQFGCGDTRARCDLVEDAGFCERELAVEVVLAKQAKLCGVKAIELAYREYLGGEAGIGCHGGYNNGNSCF